MAGTPLRILSDLHLGHPASPLTRAEQVRPLWQGAEEVWLLGDTLETCSARLAPVSRRLFDEVSALADEDGVALRLFRGNHDPEPEFATHRTLDDGRVFLTHGDACFRYGSPWSPWIPRMRRRLDEIEREFTNEHGTADLDARFELARQWAAAFHPRPRRFDGPLGKWESIAHTLWPPATPFVILYHWLRGPDIAARWLDHHAPDAQVLIMGHTHRPCVQLRRKRWIINLGAFHPFGYPRAIDYRPGQLDIRPIRRPKDGDHGFTPAPPRLRLSQADPESPWKRTRVGKSSDCSSCLPYSF